MAAEFWEQGDLERTVLDQQPIVSVASRIFYLGICIRMLGSAPDPRNLRSRSLSLDLCGPLA